LKSRYQDEKKSVGGRMMSTLDSILEILMREIYRSEKVIPLSKKTIKNYPSGGTGRESCYRVKFEIGSGERML